MDLPVYTVEEVSGADHQRQYTVKCEAISLGLMAIAKASSLRAAEKASAQEVLILALAQQQATESPKNKKHVRNKRAVQTNEAGENDV